MFELLPALMLMSSIELQSWNDIDDGMYQVIDIISDIANLECIQAYW